MQSRSYASKMKRDWTVVTMLKTYPEARRNASARFVTPPSNPYLFYHTNGGKGDLDIIRFIQSSGQVLWAGQLSFFRESWLKFA